MDRFDGRVAVVTGAASGIGLAVARAFAAERMLVLMTDLDARAVTTAADELRSSGAQVEAAGLDVRDPAAVERIAQHAVDRFGALHVAVNNAGIVNRGNSWELTLDQWRQVLDVNLWGVIHGVHAFVPRILASAEPGHVVNIASMAALAPQDRLGPYTVAKHGVLGLSDVLRAEMTSGGFPIGVSVVLPGRIKTGMNPFGSVRPEAVAANVVDAIRRNRDYVFTDDHSRSAVEARLNAILQARGERI